MHTSASSWPDQEQNKGYDYFLNDDVLMTIKQETIDNSPAPSEDIWKKFALLPTPPRSPLRDPIEEFCTPAERLSYVSEYLDGDVSTSPSPGLGLNNLALPWPGTLFNGVKLDLIHDCMWSGRCADSCRTNGVTLPDQPLSWDCSPSLTDLCGAADGPCSPIIPDSLVPPIVSPLHFASPVTLPVEVPCVDPSSVLPYTPLSDHCYHQTPSSQLQQAASNLPKTRSSTSNLIPASTTEEVGALRTSCANNGNKNTVSPLIGGAVGLGHSRNIVLSDTPSDSDDEIDVVTVPNKSIVLPTAKSLSSVVGTKVTLNLKNIKTLLSENNNSQSNQKSKPKLGRRPKNVVTPVTYYEKKIKKEVDDNIWSSDSVFVTPCISESKVIGRRNVSIKKEPKKYRRFKKARKYNSVGSRSSSDSEDCEKRSMHNSMERKRRDDLKNAFQNLREKVPEIKDNAKAPKVLILNSAATYAKQLSIIEKNLERTKKQETKRQLELQRKLKQLQRNN